ncbi:MAG: hypothetical protein AAGF28_06735 [Pseudomonadota bacterium]
MSIVKTTSFALAIAIIVPIAVVPMTTAANAQQAGGQNGGQASAGRGGGGVSGPSGGETSFNAERLYRSPNYPRKPRRQTLRQLESCQCDTLRRGKQVCRRGYIVDASIMYRACTPDNN